VRALPLLLLTALLLLPALGAAQPLPSPRLTLEEPSLHDGFDEDTDGGQTPVDFAIQLDDDDDFDDFVAAPSGSFPTPYASSERVEIRPQLRASLGLRDPLFRPPRASLL
jgi:hypothetical protein